MGVKDRRGERGQVAILFALVFTFMFILFGFVVDYANLINHKINLQNAADAAAYSGAAYEAQVLNRLGMVNYRLRQNVKEMVMRALVTHVRHNRNFPRGNAADVPAPVQPFMCQQAHGFTALSGLRYATDTNLCRNAAPEVGGLPPIVVPPVIASFDPFAVAIAAQIRKIAEASQQECRAGALDNRALAQHLINVYSARSQFHLNQGQAIVEMMNQVGALGDQRFSDSSQADNPIAKTAIESASRNLTLGNRDGFSLQIMQPQGNEYVRIQPFNLRGTMFFYDFNVVGNGCVGRPGFLDFDNVVAGYTKNQEVLTYFAVKLTSKPRLMFMPQAWFDAGFPVLTAFAAAKPFGSRIGPLQTQDNLLPVPGRPGNINRMLNFSFFPTDNLGLRSAKRMAYFDSLHPFNGSGRPDGNQDTGWPDPLKGNNLRIALQAIRAPTVFDAMFYTIFPDPNRPGDYEEEAQLAGASSSFYPDYLEVGDPNNQIVTSNSPSTAPYFTTANGAQNGAGWIAAFDPTGTGGGGGYGNYAQEGPSSHSVAIADGGQQNLPDLAGNGPDFGFATRGMVHSGWSPQRAGSQRGRIGYSVKFISFDALMRTIRVRRSDINGLGPINNPPTGDPNLDKIYH